MNVQPEDRQLDSTGGIAADKASQSSGLLQDHNNLFFLYCSYRVGIALSLIIGLLLKSKIFFSDSGVAHYRAVAIILAYIVLILLAYRIVKPKQDGTIHVSVQVILDIVVTVVLVNMGGAFRPGMMLILLLSLLGASLAEQQARLALFYASLATVALLLENLYRSSDPGTFVPLGFVCGGFFGSALVGRALARRAAASATLARSTIMELGQQRHLNALIIQDMSEGALVISAKGQVRLNNPRAEQLLGMPCAQQMLEMACAPLWASFLRAQRGGAPMQEPVRLSNASGLLQARWVPPVGKQTGDWLLFLEEYDALYARLQQEKFANMGQLTMKLAHEIRNPLSAIRYAADLLAEDNTTTQWEIGAEGHHMRKTMDRLVRIVQENSGRMDKLMTDVLAAGRLDLAEQEVIDLDEFVPTFLRDFFLGQRLSEALAASVLAPRLKILFDRDHLRRILWNLMSNALRYASHREGCLTLRAQAQPHEHFVAIHVVDDGRGIADSDATRLFEPLFTTEPKGTGLGLFICQQLCQANRAQLRFMGNNPGASFRILALQHDSQSSQS